jgi:hypothetical protein
MWNSISYLLTAVEITSVCIAIIVLAIYSRLYYKKKTHLYKAGIRGHLEQWISEMIFNEPEEEFAVSKEFYRIVKNPTGRRFVIDELLNCKKNFTGATAQNIVALYEQLGLKKYSLKKSNSRHWHIKARGIQELYLMDQEDALERIYKNADNKHEFIRMESQTGLIHLLGFEGLRFLDVASYPITEWQQIKLLERLGYSKVNIKLYENIPRWLRSSNDTVVLFALKLADEYQQLSLHDSILRCLRHPNEAVRIQSVITLVRIAEEKTACCLVIYFVNGTFSCKLAILDGLKKIATEEQVAFLAGLLNDENDTIKLKAARALAAASPAGLALLAEKGQLQPHPYEEIYLHVKQETSC